MSLKEIFSKIGFNWEIDFTDQRQINISEDEQLSFKLKNNTYFYTNDRFTKTSFYLLDVDDISENQIEIIHRRIWNENRADLFIFPQKDQLKINYVSALPNKEVTILEIPMDLRDEELLKKICKYHFESGAFWLLYHEKLKSIKRQTVDQKLIETLIELRKRLQHEYSYIKNEHERDYLIQSLIDRTLFIKFLEDKHIINSYFYQNLYGHSISYKELLAKKNKSKINKLFFEINKLFNNHLFAIPPIKEDKLTNNVLELLHDTISQSNFKSGQLNLFDFQFDIIPIEFISHIYQIFLEKRVSEKGIHYTPEGLVNLIVDDVIGDAYGTILDPACGSGVFLVLALRKMLRNAGINKENNIYKLIEKRNKFLKENIFGIEIEPIAHRITYFSLYLELLHDIPPTELNKLIKDKISNKNFGLFRYSFEENIICGNTLEINDDKKPFKNHKFDFLVGNPPWKEIKESDYENSFYNLNKDKVSGKQLSQCFLIKAKEWQTDKTKCGFVINSSSLYNEHDSFQEFFLKEFDIEKIYELSKVKEILFLKAKEPAAVVIYEESRNLDSKIEYIVPELNTFGKIFRTVLLKQSDTKSIAQHELREKKRCLRDYLIGSKDDLTFLDSLTSSNFLKLDDFLITVKNKTFIQEGMTFSSTGAIRKEFNLTKKEWDKLPITKKELFKENFRKKYIKTEASYDFKVPWLNKNINEYSYNIEGYMSEDRQASERRRDDILFEGKRVLFHRVGSKIKAVFVNGKNYFSSDIFVIKLKDDSLYHIITAVLNSRLVNYFLVIKERKRLFGSYQKVNTSGFKNIPVPKNIDPKILKTVNILAEQLLQSKSERNERNFEKMNQLVFDLYDLDIKERTRINDFFIKDNELVSDIDFEDYCEIFYRIWGSYLQQKINMRFEYYLDKKKSPIDFAGLKISFVPKELIIDALSINKVVDFISNELLSQLGNRNILSLNERIYSKTDIYIIKDKKRKSWTKTKAFEDAQAELKRLRDSGYRV
ncbi:MAG: N-6 DNA methylase [bacterium]